MSFRIVSSVLVTAAASFSFTDQVSAQELDVIAALQKQFPGMKAARGIDIDVCFPANAVEYERMGKSAILMLESTAAEATELPLQSVYLVHKGVRIPLQRLTALKKKDDRDGGAAQTSFYLLPISYYKKDTRLVADFAGGRSDFGITEFSAAEQDENLPLFARLDREDDATDPDMSVVAEVLLREYPDHADQLRQLGK